MKLTHWAWIGLIASVIWAVSAAVYSHKSDVKQASHSADFVYEMCVQGKQVEHQTDVSSCIADRDKSFRNSMGYSNQTAALIALAPIPFAWLAVVVLVYVARVQITGFRVVLPWQSLPNRKRGFVALCALCFVALTVIGILWVGNLYVDLQVPVAMSTLVEVNTFGDSVSVSGTWTRTDLDGDTIANPLQTSKIECSKATNRCTEALASVSTSDPHLLTADLTEYDVQSWTPNAIVMSQDGICATELFTIDLNTNVVSGIGHKTNQNNPFCTTNINDKSTWTYQLVKGFDVYWKMRGKARPLPVRLIQTAFGN